jgi:hypothetical protein
VVVFIARTSDHMHKSKRIRVTEPDKIRCTYDMKIS